MHIEKSLTSSDICEIIRECGTSGVTKFNLGELHISFQTRKDAWEDISHIHPLDQEAKINNLGQIDRLIRQDELTLKDQELAEKRLTDPFEYETLLAQEELTEEE